jgi:ankyrin repeat protein
VQNFLSLRADVNATPPNRYCLPALQYAAKKGFLAIAQLLLNAGAYVDAPGPRPYSWTALELAAQHGRVDMVQLLVNYGAQLHGTGATQFERAKKLATEAKFSAVTELLELLLAEQLASPDYNFQSQSIVSEENGVISDGPEHRETEFAPAQIQNSVWSSLGNLDPHSNALSESGVVFWNGVSSF